MKTKWTLTKTEHRDGTADWDLWDSKRETNHEGTKARGIAQALEKRGIPIERETRFEYSRSECGLHV